MSARNDWCPGCGQIRVKHRMPCTACWRRVPGEMRRAYLNAYRARVNRPVRWQEQQIELLQWCRNNRFG